MNIEVKVLLDTEKKRDLDMIEEVLFQLQDIKDLLEAKQQNLNKSTTKRRTNKKTTQE